MMSFFQSLKCTSKIYRKIEPLRAKIRNSLEKLHEKKASCSILLHKKKIYHGSMTLEAALIMPIFIFAILNILSIVEVIRVQSNIEAAMCETVKEMAVYGYVYDKEIGDTGSITSEILSNTVAKAAVVQKAGTNYLKHSMIKDGANGLWFIKSDVMEQDNMIDLVARYRMSPFFKIASWNDIFMINRCRMHAWTGFDREDSHLNKGEEKTVYVTDYRSVYHTTKECTHLKLSIQSVKALEVTERSNDYGQKYTMCDKCKSNQTGEYLYITNMGDKYHTSLGCSGLKRTIQEVPISSVKGLPACEKCG